VNQLSLDKEKELLLAHSIQIYRLIDEALRKGVKVAVCSTSNEKAVSIPACCTWKCFYR
jgi:predicted peroxiredoxin